MTRGDRVAHLFGYAAVTAVLASANWSGPAGMIIGAMFVLGVLGYAGFVYVDQLIGQIREEPEEPQRSMAPARTDGGSTDARDTAGARNRHDDS